jgi:hypothetical protein
MHPAYAFHRLLIQTSPFFANVSDMGDDPNKKKADAKRVSKQPHEVAYQKRKAAGKQRAKRRGKVNVVPARYIEPMFVATRLQTTHRRAVAV